MTDSVRPIPLAIATGNGNGIGHAVRSDFAEQTSNESAYHIVPHYIMQAYQMHTFQ